MAKHWIIAALIFGCILLVKASTPPNQCVPEDLCSVEVLFECSDQYRSSRACEILNVFCEDIKGQPNGTNSTSNVEQITEKGVPDEDFDSLFQSPLNLCGLSNSNGLDRNQSVSYGQAKSGEFPWTIAVFSKDQYIGGGSLIVPGVVLTAAHLLEWRSAADIVVRAGAWDLSNDRERFPYDNRTVKQIVRHAGFDYNTGANNLALLFLETPFQIQEHIRPICLPQEIKSFEGKRCKVAGWGRSSYSEMRNSDILKIIELPMVNSSTCQTQLRKTAMGPTFTLHPSLICAGGELNKDACVGDGGSALFCPLEEDPDRYEQVGIVNWGMECGKEGVPATYTNVAMFKDWIDQQLKENTVVGFRTLSN